MMVRRGRPKARKISVVLVEDHVIVREGLRALLEVDGDVRVVGEAGDGLKALELVESLKPDVLIVDVMLPGLNGLEVVRQAVSRVPNLGAVVLSMHSDEGYVMQALRNGARGYVLKCANREELIRAIREVAAGRRYIAPPLNEKLLHEYQAHVGSGAQDSYERLTNRERQVLQLVAEGCSSIEIGRRLGIGVRTVDSHRAAIGRKLDLRTPLQFVQYAIRRGLVTPRD